MRNGWQVVLEVGQRSHMAGRNGVTLGWLHTLERTHAEAAGGTGTRSRPSHHERSCAGGSTTELTCLERRVRHVGSRTSRRDGGRVAR